MPVGFGFSVGDFLAGLELVRTVIDALRDFSNAISCFSGLYALESVLIRVNRLDLEPSQEAEKLALKQAAAQCQRSIDKFWTKVRKYQPHLRGQGTSSRLQDGWAKISGLSVGKMM